MGNAPCLSLRAPPFPLHPLALVDSPIPASPSPIPASSSPSLSSSPSHHTPIHTMPAQHKWGDRAHATQRQGPGLMFQSGAYSVLVVIASLANLGHFAWQRYSLPSVDPCSTADRCVQEIRDLRSYEASKVLHVDEVARSIELKDVSFRPGSACLSERASEAIEQVGPRIAAMLTNDPALHVQIEGHTDPVPVGRLKNSCGYFATNTQLAAQRAMNVRGLIVPEALPELRARLPVLGWGPDRLRNTGDQTAAENRRVELRFQWLEVGAPSAGATVGAR